MGRTTRWEYPDRVFFAPGNLVFWRKMQNKHPNSNVSTNGLSSHESPGTHPKHWRGTRRKKHAFRSFPKMTDTTFALVFIIRGRERAISARNPQKLYFDRDIAHKTS
eukprot:gene14139-biopygen21617